MIEAIGQRWLYHSFVDDSSIVVEVISIAPLLLKVLQVVTHSEHSLGQVIRYIQDHLSLDTYRYLNGQDAP